MNRYIKKALVLSASLLMLLSTGAGINNVNAKRYHYRYHRHTKRNKYGYWKHYRKHGRTHYYFYRYKTGYIHNGKWIRYHSSKHKRATVRQRHSIARRKAALKRIKQQRLNRSITAKNKRAIARKSTNIKALFNKIKQGRLTRQDLVNIRNRQIMGQQLAESKAALNSLKQKQQAQQNYKVPFRKIDSGNSNSGSTHESTPERNEAEIKSRSFADINQDRAAYGLAPYQESSSLDQIANMRAQQNVENPNNPDTHIDPKTGNYFVDEDAQALGENIDPAENCDFANTGEQYNAAGQDVVLHNGYQMADDDENGMVNYDMANGNNNGHRNNILSPYMNNVGIGVAYYKPYKVYYLVEDFD